MAYASISQSTFFRKPKKTARRTSKELNAEEFLLSKYFEGYAPVTGTMKIRSEFYQSHVARLKMISSELKNKWYQNLIDRVYEYVASSKNSISDFHGAITPLAFVISGMPPDENKELMDSVFERIKEYTPHAASISSKSCTSIKAAFQFLCHQIMEKRTDQEGDANDTLSSSELEDDGDPIDTVSSQQLSSRNLKRKIRSLSANDLQGWFRSSGEQRPIVICIEDIDLFPVNTVQNLIMAFSCIKLPVVFIAGITCYCETFDAFVPQKCPTTFVYKTFTAIAPEERLAQFMKEFLFHRHSPFQLSGPVLRYISNIFSCQEFSISRLERILKLCLLDHYRLPKSVFCADWSVLHKKVFTSGTLTPEIISATFSDPEEAATVSLKGAPKIKIATPNAKRSNFAVVSCVTSPRKTVRQAGVQIKDLEDKVLGFMVKQLEWFAFIEFLYVIVQGLPGIPTAFNDISNLYILCWDGKIFERYLDENNPNSALDVVTGIFNTMAKMELHTRLKKGLKLLNGYEVDFKDQEILLSKTNIPFLSSKIEDFITKLENMEEEERKLSESNAKKKPTKPKSHAEFMEGLKAQIHQSSQVLVQLRENIINFLSREAKKFLRRLGDEELSSAFIHNGLEFLEEMVTPNTAQRIHAALVEPEKFLNCPSCACTDMSEINHTRADVSIIYNLILEQQMRNVNLNIIFESFKAQVEDVPFAGPSPKKRRAAVDKAKRNENLLIRFRHVIAELQQMGFVKQLKSKVHNDEVTRLNFGF